MNQLTEPNLIEVSINGHDLVVPEGTTTAELLAMVENAANAGTQNVPLEDWEYTKMLEQRLQVYDLFCAVNTSSIPPIVVHDSAGKEYYACESTTDLHKYIRTLQKQDDKDAKST